MAKNLINRLRQDYSPWISVFIICFIINLFAFAIYISHVTYSVDDYSSIFKKSFTIVSGRWVIDFVHNTLCQTNLLPTLTPIICILFYVLSGIGLCRLWRIQDKMLSVMVIALWTIHPYFLDVYNFRFSTLSLAIGYFLAVLAMEIAEKNKRGLLGSILLWYLVLSIYQPILGFGISVMMMRILLIAVRGQFSRDAVKICKRLLVSDVIVILLSIVVYGVLTKVIFVLFNVPVNSRMTAGFVSNIDQFIEKAGWLAIMFFVRLMPVPEYILPIWDKIAIFVISTMAIAAVLEKTPGKLPRLAAAVWLVLIPFMAITPIQPLVLSASGLPWRVCIGLAVFFVGLFVLVQELGSPQIRRMSLVLGWFLIGSFIFIGNKTFYAQYQTNQSDLDMGRKIVAQIQSLDNYRSGMEVAIVGNTQKEVFTRNGKGHWDIIRDYIAHNSQTRGSLTQSVFDAEWSGYQFLVEYVGLKLRPCSPNKQQTANALIAGHKPWPDSSSVFIQDGMVIVVLGTP